MWKNKSKAAYALKMQLVTKNAYISKDKGHFLVLNYVKSHF